MFVPRVNKDIYEESGDDEYYRYTETTFFKGRSRFYNSIEKSDRYDWSDDFDYDSYLESRNE